jgi:DNA-binding LacI/PurR family transcriptional regulator
LTKRHRQKKGHPKPGQRLLAVVLRGGTWMLYGFFREALQGIQRVAFSRGYGLVLVNPAPQNQLNPDLIIGGLQPVVQGVLWLAPEAGPLGRGSSGSVFDDGSRPSAVHVAPRSDGLPAVVLYGRSPELSFVQADNLSGAVAATEHLIGLGHRRIAFLNGVPDSADAQERLAGYQKALSEKGIPFRKEYVMAADFDQTRAYRAMQDLLALRPPPTAVFAANDYMALGAIAAIQDAGLSVPGHVSVVGFDDLEMPGLTFRAPPLTTVRQPVFDIAKEGTECLILAIEGRIQGVRQKVYPSQLIVRKSCGASLKAAPGASPS